MATVFKKIIQGFYGTIHDILGYEYGKIVISFIIESVSIVMLLLIANVFVTFVEFIAVIFGIEGKSLLCDFVHYYHVATVVVAVFFISLCGIVKMWTWFLNERSTYSDTAACQLYNYNRNFLSINMIPYKCDKCGFVRVIDVHTHL